MANGQPGRKTFTNVATGVSLLASPLVVWILERRGYSLAGAVTLALLGVAIFRGMIDLFLKNSVEHPDLFSNNSPELREDDARYRRRIAFWTHKAKLVAGFVGFITFIFAIQILSGKSGVTWLGTMHATFNKIGHATSGQGLQTLVMLPLLFMFNFLIFMGPMMLMGISQIRGFEPGDADWGVKLDDVRGQKEAKDEISKIITLWQSGDRFVRAGGKRERGILFLGAPGTGKTMLAKAIATGFNSPIVTIPGSGFAQTFIGIDVLIVRWLVRKAKKLASKWNGQCLIFVDEIDAVGMRRGALGGGRFAPERVDQMPGGMMGGMGMMALNQLLIAMDGVDSPPFLRRVLTNKINLYLDASYVVPGRIKGFPLRLPNAKPRSEQVYFIGATNVPLEALDPALVRPGRMGRHIYFRTPTKKDRIDIFDLYINKIAHVPELDSEEAREEFARVTQGYSPATIEQVCSLALMYANFGGREEFNRDDILEAMVTVEAGTALSWGYEKPEEELATAVHEAGHAVCAHLYMPDVESTRLSVKRRGDTGGHHQIADIQERTFKSRLEVFNEIVWGLGAYAAELVFYGHNSQGVGGDLAGASYGAGTMVGRWGMVPLVDNLDKKTVERIQKIGNRLLTAKHPGDIELSPAKVKDESIILGHAFVIAYNTIIANRTAVEKISLSLVAKKEIYGNELVALLNSCELETPEIDWDSEDTWPRF